MAIQDQLMAAAAAGDVAALAKSISKGGKINERSGMQGLTPLIESSKLRPLSVKFLLENKADPDMHSHPRTECSVSTFPLFQAAEVGNIEICRLLINAKASLSTEAANIAKQHGHTDIASLCSPPPPPSPVKVNDFQLLTAGH